MNPFGSLAPSYPWSGPVPEKRRVFISFRAEDEARVNGLRLLKDNDKFVTDFYDESVRRAYASTNADYIKREIREKIRRTKITICMVSPLTYTSRWVDWELEESVAHRNTIICMGVKDCPAPITLPRPARDLGLPCWVWDHEHLQRLIAAAP